MLSRPGTPSATIPLKRNFDDEHAPSVSSPLNPNAPAAQQPKARQQREKKETLKKRESVSAGRSTPEAASKKRKLEDERPGAPSPIRYNHELPKQAFQYTVRDLPLVSREPEPIIASNGVELKRSGES